MTANRNSCEPSRSSYAQHVNEMLFSHVVLLVDVALKGREDIPLLE